MKIFADSRSIGKEHTERAKSPIGLWGQLDDCGFGGDVDAMWGVEASRAQIGDLAELTADLFNHVHGLVDNSPPDETYNEASATAFMAIDEDWRGKLPLMKTPPITSALEARCR